jgi:hypothetical protein
MPIVINDFEIVVEPPAQGASTQQGAGEDKPSPQSTLKPEDIILVEQINRERMERVRAD